MGQSPDISCYDSESVDQIVDNVACQVGQSIVASTIVIGELGVVDAELIKNCRVDVVDMRGLFDRLPAEIVCGTVSKPLLEAAPCEPHRESVWIVIPTVVRLAPHEGAADL